MLKRAVDDLTTLVPNSLFGDDEISARPTVDHSAMAAGSSI